MQKTYFVDFRWAEAWTFAITYQVCVWEQTLLTLSRQTTVKGATYPYRGVGRVLISLP